MVGEVQESVDAVGLPSCEPPAPASGVLFDFRQSSLCTAVHSAAGRAVESVHLDSGYYVYLPENIQLDAVTVSDPCDGAVEKEDHQVEEGPGDEEIEITVRHGKKRSRCFTLCTSGRVRDLQQEIHSWCQLPPEEQRLFRNGIRLPPELSLSDLWDGISVTLEKGMQGGSGFLSWGGKKKRGRVMKRSRYGQVQQEALPLLHTLHFWES